MSARVTQGGFFRAIQRWRHDRSGLGAVEFALILPTMLLLYFGAFEVGEAVTINRKVTHIASTVGDLIAQSKTLSAAEMTNILDAGAEIMSPYPADRLTISVAEVFIDEGQETSVEWAVARNTTPLTVGDDVGIDEGVLQAMTYLIRVEVHYEHTPRIGYVLTGSFDFSDQFVLRPRLSTEVTYNP